MSSYSPFISQVSSVELIVNVSSEPSIYSNVLQRNLEPTEQSTVSYTISHSQVSSEFILNVPFKPLMYSNYIQCNIEPII